jgi:hypothetical protein
MTVDLGWIQARLNLAAPEDGDSCFTQHGLLSGFLYAVHGLFVSLGLRNEKSRDQRMVPASVGWLPG